MPFSQGPLLLSLVVPLRALFLLLLSPVAFRYTFPQVGTEGESPSTTVWECTCSQGFGRSRFRAISLKDIVTYTCRPIQIMNVREVEIALAGEREISGERSAERQKGRAPQEDEWRELSRQWKSQRGTGAPSHHCLFDACHSVAESSACSL